MTLTIAVTGLNAGENPQPGPSVIRSLRRRFGQVRIVGLSYGALESGIYAEDSADAVYQIPYPSAGINELLGRLDVIQRREAIDVLIPTLDAEILPLIGAQAALRELGIRMELPTLENFQERSKERLSELVDNVPRDCAVFSADDAVKTAKALGYPVMIKGIYYDAVKVENKAELEAAFRKIMAEWGGPVIVQQYVHGEEFNIAALGDGQGEMLASCMIRKSVRSDKGKGYGGIVIDDPVLTAMAEQVIEKLRWNGPCELEFIQDAATNVYYLLEINPRFPAWIDFPSAIGYNLPALLVERILQTEQTVLPKQCPTGHFFLRHAVDIAGRIEDLGQLTISGQLINVT